MTAQLATRKGSSRDDVIRLILEIQVELKPMAGIATEVHHPMKPFKPQGWMQSAPPEAMYHSPTRRSDGKLEELSINHLVALVQGIGGDTSSRPEKHPPGMRDLLRYVPLMGKAKTLDRAILDYLDSGAIGLASYPAALNSIDDAVRLISANQKMQTSNDRIVEEDGDGGFRYRDEE